MLYIVQVSVPRLCSCRDMRLQLLSLRKLAALFLVSRLLKALRYPSEFRRQSDIVTSGLLMRRLLVTIVTFGQRKTGARYV